MLIFYTYFVLLQSNSLIQYPLHDATSLHSTPLHSTPLRFLHQNFFFGLWHTHSMSSLYFKNYFEH